MTYYIYTLIDPRDGSIRYVGRTKNPAMRLKSHAGSSYGYNPRPMVDWILELKGEGLIPTLSTVDTADGMEDAKTKEQYWMDKCRAMGCKLINKYPTRRPVQISWEVANELFKLKGQSYGN